MGLMLEKKAAQGLTKERRLHRSRDFHLTFKKGRRIHMKSASVVVLTNDHGISRLGISVNKRIGNAVTRNRIKRYIREAFRRNPDLTSQSGDFVFFVRGKRTHIDYSAIQGDIERLLSQL
jgi:ribonuclease P protein component